MVNGNILLTVGLKLHDRTKILANRRTKTGFELASSEGHSCLLIQIFFVIFLWANERWSSMTFLRYPLAAFLTVIISLTSCENKQFHFWKESQRGSEIKQYLELARSYFYRDEVVRGDSVFSLIDTVDIRQKDLGAYYLTRGYSLHKNGNTKKGIAYIEKAANNFSKFGSEGEEAELNLITGILNMDIHLLPEAANRFFKALDYYYKEQDDMRYYYTLLGLVRTAPDPEVFIQNAEEFIQRDPERGSILALTKAQAYRTDDPEERQRLFLKCLGVSLEKHSAREGINILASLALNSQILRKNDSALHYLQKADSLREKSCLPKKTLLHYFLIKIYIYARSNNLEIASALADSVIMDAQNQSGLLSQAYLRKAEIEDKRNDFRAANIYLLRHIKHERKQLREQQDSELSLLSIQYQLKQNELKVVRMQRFWLMFALVMVLCIAFLIVLFSHFRIKAIKEKQRLNELVSLNQREMAQWKEKFKITKKKVLEYAQQNTADMRNIMHSNISSSIAKRSQNEIFDWENFRVGFILQHPLLMEKLTKRHPKLTTTDLRYCICLCSGLTNYQISMLLGVGKDAVKKAKRKLKKVFSLLDIDDISKYINSVDQEMLS